MNFKRFEVAPLYLSKPESLPWKISICSVFTAVIAVSTMFLSVNIPATRGYFNIGESAIYLTAILFGRSIGGVASGLGSMIADLTLGYWLYAPATFIIKGLEGYIVGFLTEKERIEHVDLKVKIPLVLIATITFAGLIMMVGVSYYVGLMEFTVTTPIKTLTFQFITPKIFWVFLSTASGIAILYISFRFDPTLSWHIIAVMLGGGEMILGYFLYEQLVLGVAAVIEIPINLGQVMIGSAISIPISRSIRTRLKAGVN